MIVLWYACGQVYRRSITAEMSLATCGGTSAQHFHATAADMSAVPWHTVSTVGIGLRLVKTGFPTAHSAAHAPAPTEEHQGASAILRGTWSTPILPRILTTIITLFSPMPPWVH